MKRVRAIREQCMPISACASAQSDQGILCSLSKSLDIVDIGLLTNEEGNDNTARMRRLILVIAVRIWHTYPFFHDALNIVML